MTIAVRHEDYRKSLIYHDLCFYCGKGKHRQCRRIKLNRKICRCECNYAKEFREDVELYSKLDGSDAVTVHQRLFPWKRLRVK